MLEGDAVEVQPIRLFGSLKLDEEGRGEKLAYERLDEAATILSSAFAYIEKKSGIGEGFAKKSQCKGYIGFDWETTHVALLNNQIVGVMVLNCSEPALNCVSLIGVSPSVMRKGIGRKLMSCVDTLTAQDPTKKSIRLTVNTHSTQSLPFYLALGYEIKETLCVIVEGSIFKKLDLPPSQTTAHSNLYNNQQYAIHPIKPSHIPILQDALLKTMGFERSEDIKTSIERYPHHCYLIQLKTTQQIVGFTVHHWSFAETEEQWINLMYFMLYRCYEEDLDFPEIFVPERFAGLVEWLCQLGFKLYKKMYLMVKGEYRTNGFYCPSAEY